MLKKLMVLSVVAWGICCDAKDNVIAASGDSVGNLYYVIDLSGGTSASSYPVTTLAAPPGGVWSDEYKTTKLVLRRIEAGTFKMNGSYDVTISHPFYIGVFEVTQAQWTKLSMSNSSRYKSSYYPVENMTGWNARQYIANLRTLTGVVYFCFPSDAQWLVAANSGPGGSKSANTEYVVGSLAANSIGIYDLKGSSCISVGLI